MKECTFQPHRPTEKSQMSTSKIGTGVTVTAEGSSHPKYLELYSKAKKHIEKTDKSAQDYEYERYQ